MVIFQNIGLHRHHVERTLDSVENEMYRRAFWWYVPVRWLEES